ncbi:MAG: TM0996/MTH895 family glutaredoxin-like protein [Anaerolineae bacterium]|nr:TM0996/MTH895 family glutaredoxin-like protein [Anaerolineae bacterium]
MEIKVLGTGCPNCQRLEKLAKEAAVEMGVEATFIKVTDMRKIMTYDIVGTPGLAINDKVVSSGRIPTKAEVTTWIANAAMTES